MGVSANGLMQGAPVHTNAVICDYSPSATIPVGQYDLLGYDRSLVLAHPTSGTTNMAAYQVGAKSVMTWTRKANNGDPDDAQVWLTGQPTHVVWAMGLQNAFLASPLPTMGATLVNFEVNVTGSASATPPPSPSADPTTAYQHWSTLAPGLVLSWSTSGSVYAFMAVLDHLAW